MGVIDDYIRKLQKEESKRKIIETMQDRHIQRLLFKEKKKKAVLMLFSEHRKQYENNVDAVRTFLEVYDDLDIQYLYNNTFEFCFYFMLSIEEFKQLDIKGWHTM